MLFESQFSPITKHFTKLNVVIPFYSFFFQFKTFSCKKYNFSNEFSDRKLIENNLCKQDFATIYKYTNYPIWWSLIDCNCSALQTSYLMNQLLKSSE